MTFYDHMLYFMIFSVFYDPCQILGLFMILAPSGRPVSNQFTKFAISMFAFLFCANFTQQQKQHTLLTETFAGIKF